MGFIPQINKELILFAKNSPFPRVLDLKFERQDTFDLHLYYKEPNEEVMDTIGSLHLGHWSFCDIPKAKDLQGEVQADKPVTVTVRFRLNNSGIATVEQATVSEDYEVEEEKWVEKKVEIK